MALRLGFPTVRAFERWEDDIVIDHFANFLCDYLAHGYTIVPDKKGFVAFVDLESAVEERIRVLETRRFEVALDPDKTECEFPLRKFGIPFVVKTKEKKKQKKKTPKKKKKSKKFRAWLT